MGPFSDLPRPFWAEAVAIEMLVTVKTVSKTNVILFIVILLHKEVYVASAAAHHTPSAGTALDRTAVVGVRSFNVPQRQLLRRKVRNRKKNQREPGRLRA